MHTHSGWFKVGRLRYHWFDNDKVFSVCGTVQKPRQDGHWTWKRKKPREHCKLCERMMGEKHK